MSPWTVPTTCGKLFNARNAHHDNYNVCKPDKGEKGSVWSGDVFTRCPCGLYLPHAANYLMQEMLIMISTVSGDAFTRCPGGPHAANYLMQEMLIMIIIMCVSPDKSMKGLRRP